MYSQINKINSLRYFTNKQKYILGSQIINKRFSHGVKETTENKSNKSNCSSCNNTSCVNKKTNPDYKEMYSDLNKKFDFEMANSYTAKSVKYFIGAVMTGTFAVVSHPVMFLPSLPMLYASTKFYKQANMYLKNFEKELKK